ncbi:MAG TPA: hypothetical protein VHR47_06900 [Bacillota bacterium]|nr:hypothetical protein [Bacillota bacterium]
MRRTIIGTAFILIVMVFSATWGLAATQDINVIVPARALIWISEPDILFDFPAINTWPNGAVNYTLRSEEFLVTTIMNNLGNSDMMVTSSSLQNGSNGATIPLSGFRVNLENYNLFSENGTISETLDKPVRLRNIGGGIQFTRGSYDLTVNAAQQAGQYTGTVTYTLVNR